MGPVTRRIDVELGADYQKAHTKVLKCTGQAALFRLLDSLESLLASPPLAPLASKPRGKVIPRLVKEGYQTACAQQSGKPSSIPPAPETTRPCTRHEKTANGCGTPPKPRARQSQERRTLAEAAQSVQKSPGRPPGQRRHPHLLRRLGAEAFVQGENGFSYGRLHALEQSIALDPRPASTANGRNSRPVPCRCVEARRRR